MLACAAANGCIGPSLALGACALKNAARDVSGRLTMLLEQQQCQPIAMGAAEYSWALQLSAAAVRGYQSVLDVRHA